MRGVKVSPENDLERIRITMPQAARLLGVTDARLRQLQKMGFFPRQVNSTVSLVEAVEGYLKFRTDEDRRASKTATASELQQSKKLQVDLRIAKEQGILCRVSRVIALVQDVVGGLSAELDGVPAASTRNMSDRETMQRNINGAIDRARAKISNQISDLVAARRGLGD